MTAAPWSRSRRRPACGGVAALEHFDPVAVPITCLCDTTTGFLDAAAWFGSQKGAGPRELEQLSDRLGRLAKMLRKDPSHLPFTGAAGGIAGGFWAHGARLVAGAHGVLARVGFDRRLASADVVLTGEGRVDAGSWSGKVVGEVCRRAERAGVPAHAVSGAEPEPVGSAVGIPTAVRVASSAAELIEAGRAIAASA